MEVNLYLFFIVCYKHLYLRWRSIYQNGVIRIPLKDPINRFIPATFSACPYQRYMCNGLFWCSTIAGRCGCSLCWYWWNCWFLIMSGFWWPCERQNIQSLFIIILSNLWQSKYATCHRILVPSFTLVIVCQLALVMKGQLYKISCERTTVYDLWEDYCI